MHCATAKGTTCSLIMITTNKKQVDMQWYVVMIIPIPSLTTTKVILLYAGISVLEKKSSAFIWTPLIMLLVIKFSIDQ
jgi:hypothetical protein